MIDPSEINLSSLPWLPLDARSAFPQNPAIYFAIDSNDVVQYVGRSVNPKARWSSHHRYSELQEIGNIKIVYLFVELPELLPEIESALISWFDPPLNIVGRSLFDEDDLVVVSKPKRTRTFLQVVIDPEIKEIFTQKVKANGKNITEVILEFVDQYIKDNS